MTPTTLVRGRPHRITVASLGCTEEELRTVAAARAARMSGLSYGLADEDSNYVGLLGEMAVHRWLEDRGERVHAFYLGDGDHGDLGLADSGMTIEVKTSRFDWWRAHGAVLTGSQLQQILLYGGVVWCVVGSRFPSNAVQVLGWLPLPELVESVQPTILRRRVAFQVGWLDPLESLLPWRDANRARFTWARSAAWYRCDRGHDGHFAVCLQCWWVNQGGPPDLHVYRRTFHLDPRCSELPNRHGVVTATEALMSLVSCKKCGEPWLGARENPTG